jgi:chromosome segregation ATPase
MSTSGIEANSPSQELGKLGALLSDLEANWEKGQNSSPALSVSELKELLASIEESISDLEQQIASNRELQSSLARESRELKKEIRELSRKLAQEVSQLTKSTKQL